MSKGGREERAKRTKRVGGAKIGNEQNGWVIQESEAERREILGLELVRRGHWERRAERNYRC